MFREPPIFWYEQDYLDSLGMKENEVSGEYDPRPPSGPMVPCGVSPRSSARPRATRGKEAMGMELYGHLIPVGGIWLNTPEGKVWHEERMERFYAQDELNLLPVEGYMEILIESVTYANISNPGIGVGYYM